MDAFISFFSLRISVNVLFPSEDYSALCIFSFFSESHFFCLFLSILANSGQCIHVWVLGLSWLDFMCMSAACPLVGLTMEWPGCKSDFFSSLYVGMEKGVHSRWFSGKGHACRFYLVAAEKATWVTSSSTGAIRENSARVLALAGSAQTDTVWSGNTASICAASVSASMRRTSASLSWTNWTSLDGSSSTSTLGGNNTLCI